MVRAETDVPEEFPIMMTFRRGETDIRSKALKKLEGKGLKIVKIIRYEPFEGDKRLFADIIVAPKKGYMKKNKDIKFGRMWMDVKNGKVRKLKEVV